MHHEICNIGYFAGFKQCFLIIDASPDKRLQILRKLAAEQSENNRQAYFFGLMS
jgi:hypothetical protein